VAVTGGPAGTAGTAGTAAATATRSRSSFDSLRVRNYRLWWSGQLVSQVGTWLSLTAVSWMVLTELRGNATHVGFVAAAQFLPTLLLGSWAGVLADRSDIRRLLLRTQTVLLLVASCIAVLKIAGVIELWMVFPLIAAQGTGLAFDNPARQAFVGELVGPDLIPNAVALNSAGFNSARIVGPAVAGLVIEAVGTGACLALNALSFLGAIVALLVMRPDDLHPRQAVDRAKGQIREGLRYAAREPVLRTALLTMAVVGTVSMNFTVLVPLLARTTFDTGAGTFGLLSTAMGVGSLVGSLRVARNVAPTLGHLARAALALGVCMLAAAASPTLPVAIVALVATGASMMTFISTTNSVLQLNAAPEMRGRVVSLYLILFIGSSPLGAPLVGVIAEQLGTRAAFVYGALGALVGGAMAYRNRHASTTAATATVAPDPVPLTPDDTPDAPESPADPGAPVTKTKEQVG
jgi:predicted MFS family arabinose efflux permease